MIEILSSLAILSCIYQEIHFFSKTANMLKGEDEKIEFKQIEFSI